ncbi:MAG: hypothetical protein ACI3YB_04650 [Prevotella sp.]
MNKGIILSCAAIFLLSACGTYAGSGAYAGSSLGSILGSAIGGISSGPRGSDLGTIIGMAGGAIVGGSIGAQADKKREMKRQQLMGSAQLNENNYEERGIDDQSDVVNPSNNSDDRIADFTVADTPTDYAALQPSVVMPEQSGAARQLSGYTYSPSIEIKNVCFVDDISDGKISRGELCRIVFELFNHSESVLDNVRPVVLETTGNKHVYISQDVLIEHLAPGRGIRYTAMLKADERLKNGNVNVCISVLHGDKNVSKVNELTIQTLGSNLK